MAHQRVGAHFAFTAHLPGGGPVSAEVVDVQGRRIAVLAGGWHPAGALPLHWDGRLLGGQPAAAGTYYVWVRATGRRAVEPVIVVR